MFIAVKMISEKKFKLPACLIVTFSFMGCGPQAVDKRETHANQYIPFFATTPDYTLPEGINPVGFGFIKAAPQYAGLTAKVHKPVLSICYSDHDQSLSRRQSVINSIQTWIKAFEDVAKKPLTSRVDIVSWQTPGCDAYVGVGSSVAVANTQMGVTPYVQMQPSGWFGSETVLLHEMGHAFGLLDTYVGSGGACQVGQPASVMCTAKLMHLTSDDIQGVQSLYKQLAL